MPPLKVNPMTLKLKAFVGGPWLHDAVPEKKKKKKKKKKTSSPQKSLVLSKPIVSTEKKTKKKNKSRLQKSLALTWLFKSTEKHRSDWFFEKWKILLYISVSHEWRKVNRKTHFLNYTALRFLTKSKFEKWISDFVRSEMSYASKTQTWNVYAISLQESQLLTSCLFTYRSSPF